MGIGIGEESLSRGGVGAPAKNENWKREEYLQMELVRQHHVDELDLEGNLSWSWYASMKDPNWNWANWRKTRTVSRAGVCSLAC